MNTGVRIIKRNCANGGQNSSLDQDEKTGRQIDREIANTVKNWIAELAQRRAELMNISLWSIPIDDQGMRLRDDYA